MHVLKQNLTSRLYGIKVKKKIFAFCKIFFTIAYAVRKESLSVINGPELRAKFYLMMPYPGQT